ncbi:LXG domain-containing protein [Shouchella patagoniensis]|uniref:LXG domain-containing protein n=1 Tax=Shouchella patagoniensis TaxID=228576 RepID=UPI0009954EEC|nr:LXG domain-containing protein [Shouchella patagoniensis]
MRQYRAQSIKGFFRNSHLPLIRYWDSSINKGESMLMSVKNAANSFDSHPNAYVSEGFIEGEILPQLDKLKQETAESTSNVNAILDEISDIVSIPRLDDTQIQASIDRAKKYAQITVENLYEFDYKANATMLKFAEILSPLQNYISDLMNAVESGINSPATLAAVTLTTDGHVYGSESYGCCTMV